MPIVGTSPESIHLAEERGAFGAVLAAGRAARAGARHRHLVRRGQARSPTRSATRCWSGRRTCSAAAAWRSSTTRPRWRTTSTGPPRSPRPPGAGRPVPRRRDRDRRRRALRRRREVYLGGVMEHIEEAGIHSGDSACALPPITLGRADIDEVRRYTEAIARGGVRGLLNVQYALKDDMLYVLEANPRASRTVPFVVQGDRGAAGQGGGPDHARRDHRRAARRGHAARRRRRRDAAGRRADRGQGGGAAVQAVPHRRRQGRGHPARPGDEVHRRGDGHRHRASGTRSPSRRPPRTARCRPAARSSSRWPTGTSAR